MSQATIRTFFVYLLLTLFVPGARGYQLHPIQQPMPAPDTTLPDLTGASLDLAALRGRVILVNFWASWCLPCIRELPALERMHAALSDQGGEVLTINAGETPRQIRRFLKRNPLKLKILLDEDSSVAKRWEVESMPTSFIVDSEGRIVVRVVGEQPWDDPEIAAQILSYR